MLISFFSKTEYVTWADYSSDERCILQQDIEFDPEKQSAYLDDDDIIQIVDKVITHEESKLQKHERVKWVLFNAPDLSEIDMEWEQFSDIEIGDIITARVFGGNPYAQMVLQAKVTKALLKQIAGQATEADTQIIQYGDIVTEQVNVVRRVFGLSDM